MAVRLTAQEQRKMMAVAAQVQDTAGSVFVGSFHHIAMKEGIRINGVFNILLEIMSLVTVLNMSTMMMPMAAIVWFAVFNTKEPHDIGAWPDNNVDEKAKAAFDLALMEFNKMDKLDKTTMLTLLTYLVNSGYRFFGPEAKKLRSTDAEQNEMGEKFVRMFEALLVFLQDASIEQQPKSDQSDGKRKQELNPVAEEELKKLCDEYEQYDLRNFQECIQKVLDSDPHVQVDKETLTKIFPTADEDTIQSLYQATLAGPMQELTQQPTVTTMPIIKFFKLVAEGVIQLPVINRHIITIECLDDLFKFVTGGHCMFRCVPLGTVKGCQVVYMLENGNNRVGTLIQLFIFAHSLILAEDVTEDKVYATLHKIGLNPCTVWYYPTGGEEQAKIARASETKQRALPECSMPHLPKELLVQLNLDPCLQYRAMNGVLQNRVNLAKWVSHGDTLPEGFTLYEEQKLSELLGTTKVLKNEQIIKHFPLGVHGLSLRHAVLSNGRFLSPETLMSLTDINNLDAKIMGNIDLSCEKGDFQTIMTSVFFRGNTDTDKATKMSKSVIQVFNLIVAMLYHANGKPAPISTRHNLAELNLNDLKSTGSCMKLIKDMMQLSIEYVQIVKNLQDFSQRNMSNTMLLMIFTLFYSRKRFENEREAFVGYTLRIIFDVKFMSTIEKALDDESLTFIKSATLDHKSYRQQFISNASVKVIASILASLYEYRSKDQNILWQMMVQKGCPKKLIKAGYDEDLVKKHNTYNADHAEPTMQLEDDGSAQMPGSSRDHDYMRAPSPTSSD